MLDRGDVLGDAGVVLAVGHDPRLVPDVDHAEADPAASGLGEGEVQDRAAASSMSTAATTRWSGTWPAPARSSCTTMTGQQAPAMTRIDTEPSSMPGKPPPPRLPTTTSSALWLDRARTRPA